MQKKTPLQRRAAYMRTVRRKDYDDAKEKEGGTVRFYENYANERRAKTTYKEIDMGGHMVTLPYVY